MNYYCLVLMSVTLLCVGCREKSSEPSAANNDEQAIQAAMQEYQEAFNQKDSKKFSSLWAEDATYNNPLTGEEAQGREAIAKLFKEKFEIAKQRKIAVVHKKLYFRTPSEASEQGVINVEEAEQPPKQVAFQMIFVKENGTWLIDHIGQIELTTPSSNFAHLQDVAWLVGDWKDVDPNVEITFKGGWDASKNYIKQHFEMTIYGEESIEGQQIIAWDSVENVIRSWVFDSDGGFGEGTWEKNGDSWYVFMRYTLSNGTLGSATNIYTPVGDDSYTYASIDREIDGEMLPNMDPVKVQKVK